MKTEIWKYIDGYGKDYRISNLGRIESLKFKKPKILSPTDNGKGYLIIGLSKNNKRKNYYMHRLVATAFIENPNRYKEINHKDNNVQNNCTENLEWCSRSYNVKYSFDKGTHKPPMSMLGKKGKLHPISIPVKQFDIDGNFIKEYESASIASQETNICYMSIKKCRCKKQKTAGGFVWTY